MHLPQQAATITGATVVLVDYPDALEGTAVAASDGTATLTWDAPDTGYFYRLERITTFVTGNTGGAGSVYLYEGQVLPTRLRDGSNSPTLDIADEMSPITIHPSMPVVMAWTGLTAGAKASASIQYTLWRRLAPGGS